MRKIGGVLAVACCILMLPHPAWSVAGNVSVNVKTREGPVKGATVKLVPTDPKLTEQQKKDMAKEAETDPTGAVLIPAEAGTYTVQVTADGVRHNQQVTVVGGKTEPVNFFFLPALPLMTQNPGGQWGPLRIGGFGLFQRDDLTYTMELETIFVNGSPVTTFENASPNTFKSSVNVGGLEGVFGVPAFSVPGWQIVSGFNFRLGGASADVKNTTNDVRFTGPGFLFGGGVNLAAVPSSLPQFYIALDWQYEWWKADGMDNQIGGRDVCSVLFPTAVSCQNSTELTSVTNELSLLYGYSVLQNRFVPFAGVKVRWSDLDLESETNAVVSGFDIRDRLDINFQRGPSPAVLGIVGFDFRGPDHGSLGRILGRVQAGFNDDGFDVLLKLLYEFSFAD